MEVFWDEIVSGLPAPAELARVAIRLLTAALVGAVIGIQRESVGKAAGVRTHMLVTMGTAFVVLIPLGAGFGTEAVARIIQGLAAGIGFIGGGAILKLTREREITGLTTAAGIWMTAALGVAIGLGRLVEALFGAGLAWLTLSVVARLEQRMIRRAEENR